MWKASMLSHSWFRAAFLRLFSLLGLVAATAFLRAQPAPPAVGGLPEELLPGLEPILKAALTRSPEAIRRSLEIDAADARRIIGTAPMWPTFNAGARYAVNDEAVSGNSGTSNRSSGFFYNFSLNQPVYYWGTLKAQADHEKIGLKISQGQTAEAMRLLLKQVRHDYLELVVRKAGVRVLRAQLALDEAAVTEQEARHKNHLATNGEVAVAKNTVRQRTLDIDMAEAAFRSAKTLLVRLTGVEAIADETIPDDFARPKPQPPEMTDSLLRGFTQGGVMNTYQAQVFGMQIRQSEEDYTIAKYRLYPKFSLFAGYDVRSETQASVNSINQVAVADRNYGIRTDWYLFDGWATKGHKLAALAGKRVAERQLQVHLDTTSDLARALHEQLGFAARGLEIAEERITGAQAVLKETQDELAAGRRTAADVDRAKLALLQAQASILPARAEYLNRWTEFVSLVGADPAMNNLPVRYAR